MRKEQLTDIKIKEYNDLVKQIIDDHGEWFMEFTEDDFGIYAIPTFAGMLGMPLMSHVVRIIQVRKEIGAFGSDLVFCRLMDWTIQPWENTSFFRVKAKYKAKLDAWFKDTIEYDDSEVGKKTGYNHPEDRTNISGFIIQSPFTDDHVTPMKSIKIAISDAIDEIINN